MASQNTYYVITQIAVEMLEVTIMSYEECVASHDIIMTKISHISITEN